MKTQLKWLAVGLILTLCSCSASRKAHDYFAKHPDDFALDCSNAFPVKDSVVKTDTVYKQAENVDYSPTIDSLSEQLAVMRDNAQSDSILAAKTHDDCKAVVANQKTQIQKMSAEMSRLRDRYKPCAPDTVYINNTLSVRDRAYERVVEKDRDKWKGQAEKYKRKYNWWLVAGITGWLLLALLIAVLIFRKSIPFNFLK